MGFPIGMTNLNIEVMYCNIIKVTGNEKEKSKLITKNELQNSSIWEDRRRKVSQNSEVK